MRTNIIWGISTSSVLWDKVSGRGDRSSAIRFGLSRRDFRAVMCHDFCRVKSYQQCYQVIQKRFSDQSPSNATVNRWHRHYRSGQTSLEDSDRCYRMPTSGTPKNVSRVESLIKEDPRLLYAEIQNFMKISSGSVHSILHDYLGLQKRYARWVLITLAKNINRVGWIGAIVC